MFEKPIILKKNGIELKAFTMGQDLIVVIGGGEVHLGAVAVGMCYPEKPTSNVSIIALPGHKEDVLIFPIARRLSKELTTNVCVLAGIHFAQLSPAEIMEIVNTTESLADQLVSTYRKQKK